jgi:DNA-binding transcriptional LysR family regulator
VRIELRHLNYVSAAAEHGSFRKAATALGVEESAISRRIRDLEDEIGVALFIRHHSGVKLTYAGQRFVGRAREALKQVRYAMKDVRMAGSGEEGIVRIGIFSSMASGFLATLLQTYHSAHAGVRLDVIEGGPTLHIAAVRQHQIDVAFLAGRPLAVGCDMAHLWNEQVFVALSEGHPLASREELSWADLRDQHFVVSESVSGWEIHECLLKNLGEFGYHPLVERHAVYRDTLMQLVAIGRGLALTSEAMVGARFPGVVNRPLSGEVLPFCAIWSQRNDNPAFRRLLSLAKSMSSEEAGERSRSRAGIS